MMTGPLTTKSGIWKSVWLRGLSCCTVVRWKKRRCIMEVLLNNSPPSPWNVLVPPFFTTISAPEVAWPYSAGIALVSTLISSMPTETELSEVPPSMEVAMMPSSYWAVW